MDALIAALIVVFAVQPAEITAYTARDHCAPDDPGAKWCDGLTASMREPVEGRTLACPPDLPFGTVVEIDGVGTFECMDRGAAIDRTDDGTIRFDVYMNDRDDALDFGRRRAVVRIHKPEGE